MRATCVVISCFVAAAAFAAPLPQAAELALGGAAPFIGVQASGIPSGERQALLDLYTSTNGAGWTHGTNWNGAAGTECTWYGVTCDGGGTTVQQLHFYGNNLVGTLPTTLDSLNNLVTLDLSNNQLTGPVPTQLGGLTKLQNLYLFNNQLTGSLPDLSAMTNLINLELNGNSFSPGPVPAWIASLTKLQNLQLTSDHLTGSLPTQLGSLTSLQVLDLDHNQLTGSIPSELGSLTNLQSLYLSSNQLTGSIPTSLGSLTKLQYLSLWGNQLTGPIPGALAGLTSLQLLDLSGNQLGGTIPTWVGSLTNLWYVNLFDDQLTGSIPAELASLTNLQTLILGNNQLAGAIPTWLGSLTKLQRLDLDSNQFTGSIPAELGSLTSLQLLDLDTNQLTGSIPTGLGNLTKLQDLWLFTNQLTGPIPTQLGNLTKLQVLDLDTNQLTGSIPAEFGSLAGLQFLILFRNQLAGSIPSELGSLTNLQSLFLFGNQLTGSIPVELGSLTNLQYIALNGNTLSGAIPTSLESLTKLLAGQSDLRYNALHSTDAGLTTFLNGKQSGGDWQSTQTVAPAGVAAGATTSTSVALSWTPIAFTSGTGGYQAYYSTTSGGPYTTDGITANKSASSIVVGGLNPGTLYYFVVRTVTNPNGYNLNTVTSDPSAEVHATTSSSASLTITTTSPLPAGTVGVAYSQQFAASGGTAPYTWSMVSGSLPSGLSPLSAAGLLSGTPTASGDFSFTPKVTDSASATAQGAFTLHVSACTSPSITTQPQSVTIASGQTATLSVTATGSATLSYQWYRGASGDTSNPVGTNASSFTTPALTATRNYWVRVSNSCGHADSATATVTVGPAYTNVVWVAVASHNSGKNNSQWRSDLGMLNTGTVRVNVQIEFYGSNGVVSKTTYVPAGTQSILADVVGQLNGSNSGALEILSDQPLKVTARSYNQVAPDANCYAGGTQGQDYPAVVASDGLSSGQSAYLAGLVENVASYRSNIGVVNVGSGAATVLVELFDGAGNKFTDYTVSLNPGEWKQETQPFYSKAAQTAMDRGYAKITVQSGSGVFGFASVIDNTTNDPTTVAMQR